VQKGEGRTDNDSHVIAVPKLFFLSYSNLFRPLTADAAPDHTQQCVPSQGPLTAHNTKETATPLAGFESAIPASE